MIMTNSVLPFCLTSINTLNGLNAEILDTLTKVVPAGEALKRLASKDIRQQRLYAQYLDNAAHLNKAYSLLSQAIDELCLIRTDSTNLPDPKLLK